MYQCCIHMCHRAVAWTSDVAYVCAIGLRGLTWLVVTNLVSHCTLGLELCGWLLGEGLGVTISLAIKRRDVGRYRHFLDCRQPTRTPRVNQTELEYSDYHG